MPLRDAITIMQNHKLV